MTSLQRVLGSTQHGDADLYFRHNKSNNNQGDSNLEAEQQITFKDFLNLLAPQGQARQEVCTL